jgi:hypothetical protein
MSWKQPRRVGAVIAAGVLTACSHAPAADPRMVAEWMHTLYGAIRAERLSPPVASRLMTYATTALYSGLSSTERNLPSLSSQLNGLGKIPTPEDRQGYDPTVTAVVAEGVVLDSLLREALPTTRASLSRLAHAGTESAGCHGQDARPLHGPRDANRSDGGRLVAWRWLR